MSRSMDGSRISRRVNWAAQLVVFVGMLVAFWQQRWLTGIACIAILGLMNIPLRVQRGTPLPLSPNTRALMSLLLFAWLFLGELRGYFGRFVWWDLFLHAFAGGVIALVGVRLANGVTIGGKRSRRARYAFSAAFGFSLAMAIGALWEILEFGIDHLLDREIVKPMFGDPSGLTDTLFDLIADAAGALVAGVYALVRFYRSEKM